MHVQLVLSAAHQRRVKEREERRNFRRMAPVAVFEEEHAAFSNADVGKMVCITGHDVRIDGNVRKVNWHDARYHDVKGTIKSVETRYRGKVELEDGQEFENGEQVPHWDCPTHIAGWVAEDYRNGESEDAGNLPRRQLTVALGTAGEIPHFAGTAAHLRPWKHSPSFVRKMMVLKHSMAKVVRLTASVWACA